MRRTAARQSAQGRCGARQPRPLGESLDPKVLNSRSGSRKASLSEAPGALFLSHRHINDVSLSIVAQVDIIAGQPLAVASYLRVGTLRGTRRDPDLIRR